MTLWGGGFSERPDDATWALTASVADRRLLEVDITGSLAHVRALGAAGILPQGDADALVAGLEQMLAEARNGEFEWSAGDEDVHTAVERRLRDLAGEVAGRLHTGRSRNDQVALDVRLYLKQAAGERTAQIGDLIAALADAAEEAGETVVPMHTHLQQAQAVPLGHLLLAHAWALLRDADRFGDALARIDVSPLGAGAGGGSRLPLDPEAAAEELGMSGVFDNSIDAVGSRDAVTEYLWCCTVTFVDLSRLAEEVTLWASTEFGWMTLDDRHATGSSALPHKKNPDVAELARGKAGSAIGHLAGLLAVAKALPLAYDRDLQQDKEHLFAVDDDLGRALRAMARLISAASFHPPPPGPWVNALDLAETLVERGVPFREAHRVVGEMVAAKIDQGETKLTGADLAAAHDAFQGEDAALVDPVESVRARRTPGGGSFRSVADQLASLRARSGNLAWRQPDDPR